jgi:hypothetical protein
MDQLQPINSAPPPVAPSPQLIVDAGPDHATYTVPILAPREPVMSTSRNPHPLHPNESPRAFTTVRMPSALYISLTPVPASLTRTTPATFRISSPTQPSLRSSSQTASTLHLASRALFEFRNKELSGTVAVEYVGFNVRLGQDGATSCGARRLSRCHRGCAE